MAKHTLEQAIIDALDDRYYSEAGEDFVTTASYNGDSNDLFVELIWKDKPHIEEYIIKIKKANI